MTTEDIQISEMKTEDITLNLREQKELYVFCWVVLILVNSHSVCEGTLCKCLNIMVNEINNSMPNLNKLIKLI